jgi:hypothetical protein
MHRCLASVCASGLLITIFAIGCGGSSSEDDLPIRFKSPAVDSTGAIRPSYNCGGGSLWLPLEWDSVPEDTKELAVYLGRYKYENAGPKRKLVVPFGILVSKVKPSVRRIPANTLPEGASWSYFGQNCVPARNGQKILQVLFALNRIQPHELTLPLATRITEEALRPRRSAGSPGSSALGDATVGHDQFVATYAP